MATKIDKVEFEKRIKNVQEWLIQDYEYTDIIAFAMKAWGIKDRQAKRYVTEARNRWKENIQEELDAKRRRKVFKLQRMARSLKKEHQGTPQGIRAQLAVEQEIISLEALRPATKFEVTGGEGKELFGNKSDEELKALLEKTLSKLNG